MIASFKGKTPQISETAFIASTAAIIGDVIIEDDVSIWFGAVLRGDFGKIVVRRGSSIQDNAVIHSKTGALTEIDEEVTVGHGAVLEGCRIHRRTVVGTNAVVLNGAEIGEQVMIAAGSVVVEGAHIPARVLAAGQPARVKKELSGSALNWVENAAPDYQQLARDYKAEHLGS